MQGSRWSYMTNSSWCWINGWSLKTLIGPIAIFPEFKMEKLRLWKFKWIAQGHTAECFYSPLLQCAVHVCHTGSFRLSRKKWDSNVEDKLRNPVSVEAGAGWHRWKCFLYFSNWKWKSSLVFLKNALFAWIKWLYQRKKYILNVNSRNGQRGSPLGVQ